MAKKELETYACFTNLDESILQINPVLKKEGYEFHRLELEVLDNDFSNLVFTHVIPRNKRLKFSREKKEWEMNSEFINAFTQNIFFSLDDLIEKYVIFLKLIENVKYEDKENSQSINFNGFGNFRKFSDQLIQKLRYFKNGDVQSSLQFQIDKNSRHVGTMVHGNRLNSSAKYKFDNDEEVKAFKKFYQQSLEINPLIEIADASFNTSYEIQNPKIKFVTLMTALESLFNQGKDQIAHTISRHLALIISKSQAEFFDNYMNIKALYNLRNSIVHGSSSTKENLHKQANLIEKNNQLQDLVRKSINYCRNLEMDKKQFFDYLNSKGFIDRK